MLVELIAHRPLARALVRVAAGFWLSLLLWGISVWAGAPVPVHAQTHSGITTPVMGAPVRGVVAIEGIAVHPTFRKWQLDLLINGDPGQAVFLGVSEAPAGAPTILTGWDTALYPDGQHALRLRVVYENMNYEEYLTPVRIANRGQPVPLVVPAVPQPALAPEAVAPPVLPEAPTILPAPLVESRPVSESLAITPVVALAETAPLAGLGRMTAPAAIAESAPVTESAPIAESALVAETAPVTQSVPITATEPVVESPVPPEPTVFPALFQGDPPPDGAKLIEVDLSDQTLTAWQGDVMVLHTSVSTGKPEWWTLTGTFKTYLKYEETRMRGGRGDDVYDTPDVPWTMYYDGDFAIHGAYWHNEFGTPVSHGCVNMRVDEAKALYEWAPLGTTVIVHE